MPAARPEVSSFATRTASSRPSTSAIVTVATRSGSLAHSCPSGASSGTRAVDRPAHLEARRREDVEQRGHDVRRVPVDEREVQPVADAEPVEARLRERERLLPRRRRVHVEHAAALGVRERPHAVLGGEPRERGRRLAAPAEDHERDRAGAARRAAARPRDPASGRARPPPGGRPAASSAGRARRRRAPSPCRAPPRLCAERRC